MMLTDDAPRKHSQQTSSAQPVPSKENPGLPMGKTLENKYFEKIKLRN